MAVHNELGKAGEKLAINFLLQKGYKILETNYRLRKAEIDIIAQKNTNLIVVEVKTRSTNYFGNPQDFITPKKKQLLIEAIHDYIIEKDIDVEVRFDIIGILKKGNEFQLKHIQNAFLFF